MIFKSGDRIHIIPFEDDTFCNSMYSGMTGVILSVQSQGAFPIRFPQYEWYMVYIDCNEFIRLAPHVVLQKIDASCSGRKLWNQCLDLNGPDLVKVERLIAEIVRRA